MPVLPSDREIPNARSESRAIENEQAAALENASTLARCQILGRQLRLSSGLIRARQEIIDHL
jgi:hypothetical protein